MTKQFAILLLTIQLVTGSAHADYARVIHTSKDAAQIRVDLLEQAQEQISVLTYIFEQDEASLGYMALLRKKALDNKDRKFSIRILIDYLRNGIKPAYMKALMEAGIQIKEYHRPSILHPLRLFTRLHDKIILTDKSNIVIGGRNFSASYIQFAKNNKNYVDRDVYVQSEPVAENVQKYYDTLWASNHTAAPNLGIYSDEMLNRRCDRYPDKQNRSICYEQQVRAKSELESARQELTEQVSKIEKYSLNNADPVIKLHTDNDWNKDAIQIDSDKISFYHQPLRGVDHKLTITQKLSELLNNAKSNVLIDTAYLMLSHGAEKLFKNLAKRDVFVRVTTNSLASDDSIVSQAAYYKRKKHYLNDLELDIYEWKGPETLHVKSMTVDGKIAVIGTFNIEPRAEKLNREVILVFESEEMVRSLNASMDIYIQNSRHIEKTGIPFGETEEFQDVPVNRVKWTKFLSNFVWILGPHL